MRLFQRAALTLALLFCLAPLAQADPIRIVSGSVNISSISPTTTGTTANLTGAEGTNFQFNREGAYTVSPIGSTVAVGSQLPLTFNLLQYTALGGSGGLASGRIQTASTFYNNLSISPTSTIGTNYINFTFDQAVTVPSFSGNALTLSVPFTMQANFQVVCLQSVTSNCSAINGNSYSLYGGGLAELYFTKDASGAVSYKIASFNFSGTPEPTPEPATILLLGTGLASVVGYARRKRRKNESE